ncbi:MAG: T9SS type A sorting domain-containing protein [Paludibacter sp.]|jgi:hypothetical protein|nr:T9SS type A sorting domain-containing protein [Paludibacter sp.]
MKNTIQILFILLLWNGTVFAQHGVFVSNSSVSGSVVWGNTDTLQTSSQTSGSNINSSAIQGTVTGDNISLTVSPFPENAILGIPRYGIIEGNTLNVLTSSYLNIDYDAAGYVRNWGNGVDLGAYEYQFPRHIYIAAVDTSKTQDSADPLFVFVQSGDPLLAGDNLIVNLLREEGEEIRSEGYKIDTAEVKIERTNADISVKHFYQIDFAEGLFVIKDKETSVIINNSTSLNVYPTITDGLLHIDGVENQLTVSIYNLSGTILLQKTIYAAESQIDLRELPAGILFVRLTLNNSDITKKVIKK